MLGYSSTKNKEVDHPLKMSVANLTYDEKKAEYHLDIRMYMDDFLVATNPELETTPNIDFTLLVPSKSNVRAYLEEHLEVIFNDQVQPMKFAKMKIEELTVYVEYTIKNNIIVSSLNKIQVKDSVLVDKFSNQRNVVHVELPGKKRKTLLFNSHYRELEISFK